MMLFCVYKHRHDYLDLRAKRVSIVLEMYQSGSSISDISWEGVNLGGYIVITQLAVKMVS
jgi:hypothetical protein